MSEPDEYGDHCDWCNEVMKYCKCNVEEKLKPCPFCGGQDIKHDTWYTSWQVSDADFGGGSGTSTMIVSYAYCRCETCETEKRVGYDRYESSKEIALKAVAEVWNQRVENQEQEG